MLLYGNSIIQSKLGHHVCLFFFRLDRLNVYLHKADINPALSYTLL